MKERATKMDTSNLLADLRVANENTKKMHY